MSKKWFTSDMHFFHKNVVKYQERPFKSMEEMHEAMIDGWNSSIEPEDVVYHIGDFSFGKKEETEEIIKRLNGHIHLIYGNHDKHIKDMDGVEWEGHYKTIKVDFKGERYKLVLFHYPIEVWEDSHKGAIHLHGHCHGSLVSPHADRLLRMDVGVDVWNFMPVPLENVIELSKYYRSRNLELSGEELYYLDHHKPIV